jgi:hypothetical protein
VNQSAFAVSGSAIMAVADSMDTNMRWVILFLFTSLGANYEFQTGRICTRHRARRT